MAVRDDENNVIYANFGARKRVSNADEAKVARVNHTGSVLNPSATRITAMFARSTDSRRLARGHQYARGGHVVEMEIRNGAIHGKVAGSQNYPFEVLFHLPFADADTVQRVYDTMARTPNAMKNAMVGLLPDSVFTALFADDVQDIRLHCSCPDPERVCKHAIAVADRLAAAVDADPLLMFQMRGIERHQLEESLIESGTKAAQDSLTGMDTLSAEERNELFWNGRALPDLPTPKKAPTLEDSDMDLLRKALRAVSITNIDLLRAVSDIEDMYDYLTR